MSLNSHAQNIAGVYGECYESLENNDCNRFEFIENGFFTFYQFSKYTGHSESPGFWKQKGDTLILKSKFLPTIIFEKNIPINDSVQLCIIDTTRSNAFREVTLTSKNYSKVISDSSSFIFSKTELNRFVINYLSTEIFINFSAIELKNISKIKIYYSSNNLGNKIFINEKILIQKNMLFDKRLKSGSFDKTKYYKLKN